MFYTLVLGLTFVRQENLKKLFSALRFSFSVCKMRKYNIPMKLMRAVDNQVE